MGKKVRLMAGAAGMAPVFGLAAVAPAAAAPAVHASGKKVSLQAGRAAGATACGGTSSNIATKRKGELAISVSYEGTCVLGVLGHLYTSSPSSVSGDTMRTRVYHDNARVFSGRARFGDSSQHVSAYQKVGMIGHKVCVAAFSQLHPTEKVAGPVCVKI